MHHSVVEDLLVGFEVEQLSSLSPSISSALSKENLQNTQVWHVTAPQSMEFLGIKKIKIKPPRCSTAQDPDTSNRHYVHASACPETSTRQLLVPADTAGNYVTLDVPFEGTLNLHQSSVMSRAGNRTKTLAKYPMSKTRPQQPKHLKMRFTPFGDSSRQARTTPEQNSGASQDFLQVSHQVSGVSRLEP